MYAGVMVLMLATVLVAAWHAMHPLLRFLLFGTLLSWGIAFALHYLMLFRVINTVLTGAADLRRQKREQGYTVGTRPSLRAFFTRQTVQQVCEDYEAAVEHEVANQRRARERAAEEELLRQRAILQEGRRRRIAMRKRERFMGELSQVLMHPRLAQLPGMVMQDLETTRRETEALSDRRKALERVQRALCKLEIPASPPMPSHTEIAIARMEVEASRFSRDDMEPDRWQEFSATLQQALATHRERVRHRLLEQALQIARGELPISQM